jgi:hypothetical protein
VRGRGTLPTVVATRLLGVWVEPLRTVMQR